MGDDTEVDLGIGGFTNAVPIGRGGFAVVYRAYQPRFDRLVAVKVFVGLVIEQGTVTTFERECRAIGRLSGRPNILQVYDAGISPANKPYMVMAYMAGGTLDKRLRDHGPLPWEEAAGIGVKMARALQAAHDANVLHRDVKPENVLLSGDGEPYLADFGISRLTDATRKTRTSVSFTPAHVAPEIVSAGEPSPAIDIYSLASTLFEVMSGQPAFVDQADDNMLVILRRVINDPVPDLLARHGVPEPLRRAIEGAMAKNPADRPPSAAEFARRLEAATAAAKAAVPAPVRPAAGAPDDDRETLPSGFVPAPSSFAPPALRMEPPSPALAAPTPGPQGVPSVSAVPGVPPGTPSAVPGVPLETVVPGPGVPPPIPSAVPGVPVAAPAAAAAPSTPLPESPSPWAPSSSSGPGVPASPSPWAPPPLSTPAPSPGARGGAGASAGPVRPVGREPAPSTAALSGPVRPASTGEQPPAPVAGYGPVRPASTGEQPPPPVAGYGPVRPASPEADSRATALVSGVGPASPGGGSPTPPPGVAPPLRGGPVTEPYGTPPLGVSATPPRRRGGRGVLVAVMVIVVVAIVVVAVILLSHRASPSSNSSGNVGQTTTTVAATTSVTDAPTTATTVPVTTTSLVSVANGVVSPDASGIELSLATYFQAVNNHDWQAAWNQFTPAEQARDPTSKLAQGDSSTTDSVVVVAGITAQGGGTDVAAVSFTSRQQPVDSPDHQPCDRWTVDFVMASSPNGFLIDRVIPSSGTPYQPCS